jgi:hypothetical protein
MHAFRIQVGLIAMAAIIGGGVASGQGVDRRASVGVKAGVNHEQAEDGLRGTVGAVGLAVRFPMGPSWGGELELWVPGFIEDGAGAPRHRDIQAGFSVVRHLGSSAPRPFVLFGGSIARTEDRFTTCLADRVSRPGTTEPVPTIVSCTEPDVRERRAERFVSSSAYAVAGAGVDVPLGSRWLLTPEVRLHAALTSVIVRASVGLAVQF